MTDLRNRELNRMFGSGFNSKLRNRVSRGEFLFSLSAKTTVLNRDQLRSYISVRWDENVSGERV